MSGWEETKGLYNDGEYWFTFSSNSDVLSVRKNGLFEIGASKIAIIAISPLRSPVKVSKYPIAQLSMIDRPGISISIAVFIKILYIWSINIKDMITWSSVNVFPFENVFDLFIWAYFVTGWFWNNCVFKNFSNLGHFSWHLTDEILK